MLLDAPNVVASMSQVDATCTTVPLTEEVADVRFPHVVDRFRQRTLLSEAGIHQPRFVIFDGAWVAKRRQSTMNSGVWLPRGAEGLMLEEHISGDQLDVNAVVDWDGRVCRVWPAVLEVWSPFGNRIVKYVSTSLICSRAWLQRIAGALNLRGCGMNVEFRETRHGPCVIEAHARLGEDADNDYYAKWAGGENPFEVLIDELGTQDPS